MAERNLIWVESSAICEENLKYIFREEILQKETHIFKNLEITEKPTEKIINCQLYIELG